MAQKESKRTICNKIKEYINILQENGIEVWRLYLFGSCAKDRFTPDSDIDLAIFLDTDNIDGFLEDVKLMHLRRTVAKGLSPEDRIADKEVSHGCNKRSLPRWYN